MHDPHICIEADPLSKMHGVPSHETDRIQQPYLHHGVCPLEEKVKRIRFRRISLFFIMKCFWKMGLLDQPVNPIASGVEGERNEFYEEQSKLCNLICMLFLYLFFIFLTVSVKPHRLY